MILAILSLSLNGCGWRLRGSQQMDLALAPLYLDIKKGSSTLRNDLRQALLSSNVQLVDNIDDAELVLVIHNEQQGRRVLSVGSSGKVSDYELQYAITFSVHDNAGNEVMAQDSISQQRDYSFDETEVLAKGEEERRLFDFMRRMSIQSLIRRLQALNNVPAPASTVPADAN